MLGFVRDITNAITELMGKEECEGLNLLINTKNVNIIKCDSSLSESSNKLLNEFLEKLVLSINNN